MALSASSSCSSSTTTTLGAGDVSPRTLAAGGACSSEGAGASMSGSSSILSGEGGGVSLTGEGGSGEGGCDPLEGGGESDPSRMRARGGCSGTDMPRTPTSGPLYSTPRSFSLTDV